MIGFLIIEDEAPAARQLTALLAKIRPEWKLLSVCDSISASVEYLQTHRAPHLIFMDIQLADGLSFSIFDQIEVQSQVIFCTAFDQFAVEAFKRNAVHYLLKPVAPADLATACQRFELKQAPVDSGALKALVSQFTNTAANYKDRFLVKSGTQLMFLETEQIAWIRSSGGLTEAWVAQGKRYLLDHTLDDLEELLNPKQFFRISRQLMVSLPSLKKIVTHLNGRLKLELAPNSNEEIFVSRERVADFKTWLGG